MKNKIIVISFFLVFGLILAGCNMPGQPTPIPMEDVMNTAAAQTLQALQTNIVQTNQVIDQQPTPTATLEPVVTENTPEPTAEPTVAPTSTPTLVPTAATPCDRITFVSETIPDGTDFAPGTVFTKTWTLKNAGSCTWNSDYDVVFVSGNAMNAPAASVLTNGVVPPGDTVKISMELKAPATIGTYQAEFRLRNANGVLFGIGDQNKTFWAKIDVTTPTETFYDFSKNYCASGVEWTTEIGILPCPGSPGDEDGWVVRKDDPILETGKRGLEPGLQVQPGGGDDGYTRGIYPEITVPNNAYFTATIGCYNTTNDCDVKFKLNYIVNGSTEKTLMSWQEIQDGKVNNVAVDLSDLAGKKVKFILLVEANGRPYQDKVLWYQPLIVK
jgi:hypothetical protein